MPVTPCTTPTPITLGIVVFSASEFLGLYPEFTGINNAAPSALQNNFNLAQGLVTNSCGSTVQDANERLTLLYLLTAHITQLRQGINDAGLGNPAFSGTASISGNTLTISAVLAGAVAVNSTLVDTGGNIIPGTTITALGTGTGGLGTYTVNGPTQNVGAEQMYVAGVPNVQPPLGVVGRITDASEGAVSVSAAWEAPQNPSQPWYVQTEYGATYWTLIQKYMRMLNVPAPTSAYEPLGAYAFGPFTPGWGNGV